RSAVAATYDPESNGAWDDLALVVLTRAPDLGPIPPAQSSPLADARAEVVGYGVTRASGAHRGTGAGLRRHVAIRFDEIGERELSYDSSERGACYGDSGGPLIQDLGAGEVVVGVTSRGTGLFCDG